MFHEHHHRTLFKTITWMVTAFLVTTFVLYLIQGNWKLAAGEAVLVQAIKMLFYYIHERLWNKSNYGQSLKTNNIKK